MSVHPADWKRMTPEERRAAAHSGAFDAGEDWRVERVAHLTGLDAGALGHHVEAVRGWEPHDKGFLHEVVVSARVLLGRAR